MNLFSQLIAMMTADESTVQASYERVSDFHKTRRLLDLVSDNAVKKMLHNLNVLTVRI